MKLRLKRFKEVHPWGSHQQPMGRVELPVIHFTPDLYFRLEEEGQDHNKRSDHHHHQSFRG